MRCHDKASVSMDTNVLTTDGFRTASIFSYDIYFNFAYDVQE